MRLRHLIEKRGLGVDEFARDYGISQSQAFNWLKRDEPPLTKHWEPLAKFFGVSKEFLVTGIPKKLETAADYATDHGRDILVEDAGRAPAQLRTEERVLINAAHQPRPAEPTPQACIDHFLTYLKAAEHAPGGLGLTWWKLQKTFPLDEFQPPQK